MPVHNLPLPKVSVVILWHYARFQGLAEVEIKSLHFFSVTLRKYVYIHRRFEETDRFLLQGSSIPGKLSRKVGI
jgi:hypothetical protein